MDFDFQKYKILFCDEDAEVLKFAQEVFENQAVGQFIALHEPNHLLGQLPILKPDLIVLSIKYKTLYGAELVHKIRKLNDGDFFETPILMTLDKVAQGMMREICRAGIEGALRKPLSAAKLLRFSRAVLLKPRRFICVNHYFGPERRVRNDPHYNGVDRRKFRDTPSAGKSQLSGQFGVDTMVPDTMPKPEIDWGKSQTLKNQTNDFDFTDSDFSSNMKTSSKDEPFLFGQTNERKQPSADFDFGQSETLPKKSNDIELSSLPSDSENPLNPFSTNTPEQGADKESSPLINETFNEDLEVQPAGPEDDNFDEVIGLEETLDLHKEWINSGGKSGKQAKRPHSDFRGQDIAEADFTKAHLPQSCFDDMNCSDTVFRKADLQGSTFKNTILTQADLRVTRLKNANLSNARMNKANLLGADLSGANLEGAQLHNANLSGANLQLTNLRGANLSNAQGLLRDQIQRAITDSATRLPTSLKKSTP